MKSLGDRVKFVRYVVCKKCHKLYYVSDCIEGTTKKSKKCSFQRFPEHSMRHMRLPCDSLLLKTVEMAGGRTILYPFVTYCYLNLDTSMQMLLNRPGFYSS